MCVLVCVCVATQKGQSNLFGAGCFSTGAFFFFFLIKAEVLTVRGELEHYSNQSTQQQERNLIEK